MSISGIKHIAGQLVPGIMDRLNLQKQINENEKQIKEVKHLDDSDYPKYLSKLYQKKTGNELDLCSPKRLTEKIQWRKLNDRDPIYSKLSDKYFVRDWVKSKIGEEYLVPLLGHWKRFNEIDFSKLPDQFVLKTNNASHTVIIVKDKKCFMRHMWAAKKRIEYWLRMPFAYTEGLELHYLNIEPQIIAEELLCPENGKHDLEDYKFHCFNGEPVLCQVIGERTKGETIDFFDMEWNHMSVRRPPYPNAENTDKPINFEEMKHIAEKLSRGFQYVRVDLYEQGGKIYFGEMTFTPASGMMRFAPDEWDYKLGKLWNINTQQIDREKVGMIMNAAGR